MKDGFGKLIWALLAVLLIAGLGYLIQQRLAERNEPPPSPNQSPRAVPVEVAAVEVGPIQQRRMFSGTLESPAEVVVASKVGGRIERLTVDLADTVERGQLVAELDSAEYRQAVRQAEAELAVAKANLAEARSRAEIAQREISRAQTLTERGIASEAQLDTARASQLASAAAVTVAQAQVTRAEAALETARIRLDYTRVRAAWHEGDDQRVVGERLADEGDTVGANAPLLSIVELSPIRAVITITERDYAQLKPGQAVTLTTDAYPGQTFPGQVARVAPVFEAGSRQARVELTVPNEDHRLKPGMFVRAQTVLGEVAEATIVPEAAVVMRNDQPGVFVLQDDQTVTLRPVRLGIRDAGRVQVIGEGVSGRVVTLGQQLLDEGTAVTLPNQEPGAAAGGSEAAGS